MFKGWHHICINVSDLERSLKFYTEILGLKVTLRADIDDAEISRAIAIPGAKIAVAFLEVPGTPTLIEMFEYVSGAGRPVQTLKVSECTTLGAAILGAAGAGVFSSVEEAVEHMVHPGGLIEPDMIHHAVHEDMFSLFKDTFLALNNAGIYDKFAAVQNKHWG